MKALSLYIHVPFCVRKCNYCDFLSAPAGSHLQARYFSALKKEIEMALQQKNYDKWQVISVFFGGGTPSLPKAEFIVSVLELLREKFVFSMDAEITLEMNPGTETREKLEEYRNAGVNRLSIGCQSMQDEELQALGRIHNRETLLKCFRDARKAGFDNINVDLMSALPGQTLEKWEDTLEQVLALSPEHISAYSLIIEEGTPFWERYGENVERQENFHNAGEKVVRAEKWPPLPEEEEERKMYERTLEILETAGYHRYEISNYARNDPAEDGTEKETFECRHNKVYWQRGDYLGFGLGAASMVEDVRWTNTRNMDPYLEEFEEGAECVYEEPPYQLTEKEQQEEFMFLGLRMIKGVSRTAFHQKFGISLEKIYGRQIRELKSQGLLQEAADHVALTSKGLDLSNYVEVQFLQD